MWLACATVLVAGFFLADVPARAEGATAEQLATIGLG
jgi:hypothetical protein